MQVKTYYTFSFVPIVIYKNKNRGLFTNNALAIYSIFCSI
jgi:hypothetical protein